LDASGQSQDPRRAGARILDIAEGVLIALRGCSLNQAFVEIVQTAKAHNVSTFSLADALVDIAQTRTFPDVDDAAFVAARAAWGPLFDRNPPRRAVQSTPGRSDDEDAVAPGA
jgi:ANTAR domain-containing protein